MLLTVSLMESHPDLPADLRDDVATIRRNVELESRLISDLLDLTRIARGKLQLDEQDVDLHLIVRVGDRHLPARGVGEADGGPARAAPHGARRRHAAPAGLLEPDQQRDQVHARRTATITVRSYDTPTDGRMRVEVSDTGAGIDPAVLPRLFNAFEQGEVRAGRQQAGLGLGLAISKKLAEAHGGTITARQRGPRPRRDVHRRTAGCRTARPERGGRAATRPPRAPAAPAAERAAGRGPRADASRDGEAAAPDGPPRHRRHARSRRRRPRPRQDGFDLIISDLGLPDGSGLDVMRQLRDRYAGRAIALTGYGMESDIAASRAAGFAEHLTKPVDLAALDAAIRRVAGGSRANGSNDLDV